MVIDYKQWYDNNCEKFDEIRGIVVNELERILELEGFRKKKQVILVDSRVKKYNSFIEKMLKEENGKRKYSDPTQITDMQE